ncbi:MAG: PrgI family protein [Patescibacteria group bacterium]
MEQHPIPQQISSYQFRLVGDMTLKQFFQVAAGALISLLIYSTGLHPVLKWPLIMFFLSFGAALAFLPFQERPLERWVLAFFRSIYSPTMYNWQPYPAAPAFYMSESTLTGNAGSPSGGSTASSNGSKLPFLSNLEEQENNFLNKLGTLFVATPMPVATTQPNQQIPILQDTTRPQVTIPQVGAVAIAPTSARPQFIVEAENNQSKQIINPSANVFSTSGVPAPSSNPSTNQLSANPIQARFSSDAAPPSPAENPNLIVGQVMDSSGKIIEGAILEIKDDLGRPVRALKSNKAGHFMIVTPLLTGKYELTTEKDGFEFDPLTFETRGEIIQPIAIRAKNSLTN